MTRTPKSAAQRATETLGFAQRRVARLTALRDEHQAHAQAAQDALDHALARLEHAKADPDLATTEPPAGSQPT